MEHQVGKIDIDATISSNYSLTGDNITGVTMKILKPPKHEE